jgi:hypothetical protein
MISKIPSIIIFFAAVFVISSNAKLTLPSNYTWPLNAKRLCFAARFDLSINVNYTKTDGTNVTVNIPLNNDTFQSYSVSCGAPSNVHELTIAMLNWFSAIILSFSVDSSDSTSLTKVYGYITVDNNQNYIKDYAPSVAGLHKFTANESLFQAKRDHSFRCNTKTHIKDFVTNSTSFGIVSIDVENLRIEPFVDDSKDFSDFDAETVCKTDNDKDSNLIPIIVGACLGVLVVIVLVAYLIGRQRTRPGYQTV